MGKYISGIIKCEIQFDNLYVDDGENNIDVIFPEGFEGEMISEDLELTQEDYDEEE